MTSNDLFRAIQITLVLVSLCWHPPPSTAQVSSSASTTATVAGTVRDAASGEPVPGAIVSAVGTSAVALAAADGSFELAIPPGHVLVRIEAAGYLALDRPVDVAAGARLALVSLDLTGEGEVIVVTPGTFSIMGARSNLTMTSDDIKNMSWAEDVTRAVARLPGISSSDYSSKFSIRGGDVDEVLFTLDGMELYEPFHQRDYSGGLFSIVDIEAIEGVDLNTGGFGARNGNRLSGLLHMHTKQRATDGKRHASFGLSVMNARAYSDGPFDDDRGFYLVSARRGMLDLLFKAVGATENLPAYYDALGKVSYRLDRRHTLSLHALYAGDTTTIRDIADENFDKNDTRYTNSYSWLTLKSGWGHGVFSDTMLYASYLTHDRRSEFNKQEPTDKGVFMLDDQRTALQVGLKQDWSWIPRNGVTLEAGFDARTAVAHYDYTNHLSEIRIDSAENELLFDETTTVHTDPSGQQIGGYVAAKLRWGDLFVEPGLRFDHTSYADDQVWSPRLAAAYLLAPDTIVRAAWGRYYQSQFIDKLDVNHGNAMFDHAKLATHYVLGVEQLFPNGIAARVEGYYKKMSRLPPMWTNLRDHLEAFPEQRNDNVRLRFDGASSQGVEVFLKYDRGGRLSWWLSYALARAEDDLLGIDFDGVLAGRTGRVPRLNNQRHTVFADVNYRPTKRWTFNLSWHYYVGWPRTGYTYGVTTLADGRLHFYPIAEAYNSSEYPAYHRMDLRINRHFKLGRGKGSVFLHVINLYNHANLKKFDLDSANDAGEPSIDAQGNYIKARDDAYWFGITPVVGVSWETEL